MKTVRDLYHELHPHACMLADLDDPDSYSSHRYECDQLHEWLQVHDREVAVQALRAVANLLALKGYNAAEKWVLNTAEQFAKSC